MTKFWRVVRHEYLRHVLRRRFLFALLSVPMVILAIALVIVFQIRSESDLTPVGYVDRSGVLNDPVSAPAPAPADQPVPISAYPDEAAGRAALASGEIQALYLLPEDYLSTGEVRLIMQEEPSDAAQDHFEEFLIVNLLEGEDPAVTERVVEGAQFTVRTLDGRREMSEREWFNIFLPFITGLAFIIAIFTSSGYLMQAVVDEKENRTMEVLITSVSPFQLMGGKVVGIIGVGLTQILIWSAAALVGVLVGRNYFEALGSVRLSLDSVAWMAAVLLPGYVMVAGLMAAVGATVTEAREGQQISGLFTLPIMIPYWFVGVMLTQPNGPVSLALSFFPLTAPVALSIRLGITVIPLWQLLLNWLVLALSALGAMWLASAAFRLGMLRYGQRLSLRELWRGIRAGEGAA